MTRLKKASAPPKEFLIVRVGGEVFAVVGDTSAEKRREMREMAKASFPKEVVTMKVVKKGGER